MANILYGVNGEGSGHSTRAREVLSHLQAQGHLLHVASFDRGLRNLGGDFEVTEIYGLRLAFLDNTVRYRRTIAANLLTVGEAARSLARLLELSRNWNIDLVITDFEPLTCRIARHMRLPVIAIDNQHALTNLQVSLPRHQRADAAAAKMVTRFMVPRANAYLVLSFFEAPVVRARTWLFPPVLRAQILQATATESEHVLVYVTSPAPELARLLRQIRCPFIAYGFDRAGREGNIVFKKPSMEGFLKDLASAKAVVANSGFSLVTEALHLGKPYLPVPVKHQYEQTFNAYWIERMGYGPYWDDLNHERIESFLYNLPQFRERLRTYPRVGNQPLLQALDGLIAEYTSAKARVARRGAAQ
jgi:uncharacterized protein (TIGR00661 family)